MKQSIYEFDTDGDTTLNFEAARSNRPRTHSGFSVRTTQKQSAGETIEWLDEQSEAFIEEYANESSAAILSDSSHNDREEIRQPNYATTAGLPDRPVQVQMRVSSRHLALASPVFQKMLEGPWREAEVDNFGRRQISASGWDLDAFVLLLDIIHGHHREVPKSLSFEMLAKVAIVVDYYACHETVEIFVDRWLDGLRGALPTVYSQECVLWLLVSWVFSKASIFESITELAVKQSKKPIAAQCLPIPECLLSKIDAKRQEGLARIFASLYSLLDTLLDQSPCSFECSSILFGSLAKEMNRNGILEPRVTAPFYGHSFTSVSLMVYGFRSPSWTPSYHTCSIREKVEPTIRSVEEELHGLKLEEDWAEATSPTNSTTEPAIDTTRKGKKSSQGLEKGATTSKAQQNDAVNPDHMRESRSARFYDHIRSIPLFEGAREHLDVFDRETRLTDRFYHICAQARYIKFSPEELRWKYELYVEAARI